MAGMATMRGARGTRSTSQETVTQAIITHGCLLNPAPMPVLPKKKLGYFERAVFLLFLLRLMYSKTLLDLTPETELTLLVYPTQAWWQS